MNFLDVLVLMLFLVGMIAIGYWASKKMTNTSEMFSAGGKSPWWMSGISAYMTMFSAGTFVVWGGVAYRLGVVSIIICMSMGLSALIAGYVFAGKWKESGATSAAEFVRNKYGNGVMQMYTWLGIITRIIGVAVALYSVAVIVCSLIPLSPDNPLANANGTLDVNFMIVVAGLVIVLYTFMGGFGQYYSLILLSSLFLCFLLSLSFL